MVNFDNAATTFPKPQIVIDTAFEAMTKYGGNPGRSGHKLSLQTSEKVYNTREEAAEFFNAFPENVVFTVNCTYALNMAIKGVARYGDEIIISSLEHNSAARPAIALTKNGVKVKIVNVSDCEKVTLENLRREITLRTRAIVFTLGSNVTGQITPYRRIGEMCKKAGICFIADGAQAAGIIPVDIKKDNINILCCPGHKGLYGPAGTGMLITDGKYKIMSTIQGGTGSESLSLTQPEYMPDALESGTVNTSGIIALGAGIKFIKNIGMDNIYNHEKKLCEQLMYGLADIPQITIYRSNANYLPIVLFNINGLPSSETAAKLSDMGFALRGGLHCSGLAHKTIGTAPEGAVRFSPSYFNTSNEVNELLTSIKKIVNEYAKK
jgi:cysteine desulfurase family protein